MKKKALKTHLNVLCAYKSKEIKFEIGNILRKENLFCMVKNPGLKINGTPLGFTWKRFARICGFSAPSNWIWANLHSNWQIYFALAWIKGSWPDFGPRSNTFCFLFYMNTEQASLEQSTSKVWANIMQRFLFLIVFLKCLLE